MSKVFELTHNGVRIYAGEENSCWIKLQRVQGRSCDYATKHGGYKVLPIDCSEEEAKKIIEADMYAYVDVILDENIHGGHNHWVKIKSVDGRPGKANTYAMKYGSSLKGSPAQVMRNYLSFEQ